MGLMFGMSLQLQEHYHRGQVHPSDEDKQKALEVPPGIITGICSRDSTAQFMLD